MEQLKDDLDIIINGTGTSWAPFKAIFASVHAKLEYPDWDTRLHQVQIGGKYSLRTIDSRDVAPLMYKLGLYDTVTTYSLTRSFEKAEPFDENYSGKIKPANCKTSFLNIQKIINTNVSPKMLTDTRDYMLQWLKTRKDENDRLKQTLVTTTKSVNFLDVSAVCEYISKLGTGSSVVPSIMVHAALTVSKPDITIKSLKEHTASDKHTKAYGDVEGFIDSRPVIAVEVKHKIKIDETIIRTFDEKTHEVPLKFIVTTAATPQTVTPSNIWIYSLNDFVLNMIQHKIVDEKDICAVFIQKFREGVVKYPNISIELKNTINDHLTAILASPSP